jgi:hypothetical protein
MRLLLPQSAHNAIVQGEQDEQYFNVLVRLEAHRSSSSLSDEHTFSLAVCLKGSENSKWVQYVLWSIMSSALLQLMMKPFGLFLVHSRNPCSASWNMITL